MTFLLKTSDQRHYTCCSISDLIQFSITWLDKRGHDHKGKITSLSTVIQPESFSSSPCFGSQFNWRNQESVIVTVYFVMNHAMASIPHKLWYLLCRPVTLDTFFYRCQSAAGVLNLSTSCTAICCLGLPARSLRSVQWLS